MTTQITTTPSEELLGIIWDAVQHGAAIADDISGRPIEGIEHYADLIDLDHPRPLSAAEQRAFAQASAAAPPSSSAEDAAPPHRADLEAATRAFVARRRDAGGEGRTDVGAARAIERAIKATALIAQHVHDVHGRFPATVPGSGATLPLAA